MAEQDFPPAQVELCQLYLVHPLPLHLNSRALKQVLEYVPFKKDKVSSKFSAEQSYFVGMAIQLKEFGKRPNIPLAKEYLTTSFAVNYAWAGLAKVKLVLADAVPNFEDIMELVNKVYLFAKRNNDWVLRNACIDLLEPWASSHDAVEQFVVHGKRERAAEFQYEKGLRLLKVEKFDEAKECFVRAVSDDKEHAQAQTELATVGSKKAEANYQKGLAYIKDEKYEAAVPFFQVAIDNGHIDAHLPMGNIYASWKKPTDSKLAEHYFSSYKDKKIAKLLQKADKQSLQETVALFEKGFLENRDGARISLLPLERSGLLDHVYSQSCKGNAVALSLFRDLEREKMKLDIDFKEDKLIFSYRERNRRYPSEERNDYNFELIEALGEIKKYTARLLNPKDNTERRSALDKLAAMKLEMSDEIEAMHPIVFYARALKCDDVSGKRELFAQALRHHAKPYFLEWPLLGEVITYLRQPAPSAPALEGVPNLPKQGLEGEADQIVQSLRYQH